MKITALTNREVLDLINVSGKTRCGCGCGDGESSTSAMLSNDPRAQSISGIALIGADHREKPTRRAFRRLE